MVASAVRGELCAAGLHDNARPDGEGVSPGAQMLPLADQLEVSQRPSRADYARRPAGAVNGAAGPRPRVGRTIDVHEVLLAGIRSGGRHTHFESLTIVRRGTELDLGLDQGAFEAEERTMIRGLPPGPEPGPSPARL